MSATHDRGRRQDAVGQEQESMRVDIVDNRHKQWPTVLRALERSGDRASLNVDANGWLSARQSLLVAFVDDQPAAHVGFHVQPAPRARRTDRACVEAQLDFFGIDPRFCGHGIERTLRNAALQRASALRCEILHGFELNEKWC